MDTTQRFSSIEERARDLPWGDERPWRASTHLNVEHGLLFIDLHDLSVRLALDAVGLSATDPPAAIGFITGRGKHNPDGQSPLREAVLDRLDAICDANPGWTWRSMGPGSCVLITDAGRAPAYATGALPWPVRLGALAALLLFAIASPLLGGPVLLAVLFVMAWKRWR